MSLHVNLNLGVDIPLTNRAAQAASRMRVLGLQLETQSKALRMSGNAADITALQQTILQINCQHALIASEREKELARMIHLREAAAIEKYGDLA